MILQFWFVVPSPLRLLVIQAAQSLSDDNSTLGPELPEFTAHRHDQVRDPPVSHPDSATLSVGVKVVAEE